MKINASPQQPVDWLLSSRWHRSSFLGRKSSGGNRADWFHSYLLLALIIAGIDSLAAPAAAATVTLTPKKDTTIYGPDGANLSSGAGGFIFAGRSGHGSVMRGLLAFDIAGQIPAGSTINSVSLTLAINTPHPNSNTVELHRVLADWGESPSSPSSGGGGGAPAGPGDGTWNARFFGPSTWTTPGGDFSSVVSASQFASGSSGTVLFTSAALAAD